PAHGGGQALPARRSGRPQGRRLGRPAVDATDPRRRDAAEEGVMLFPFGVIASTRIGASRRPGTGSAKRSPAADRVAEIASSRFALLAMTLLLGCAVPPALAADGDVDQGRDTYQDLCSTCHGRD